MRWLLLQMKERNLTESKAPSEFPGRRRPMPGNKVSNHSLSQWQETWGPSSLILYFTDEKTETCGGWAMCLLRLGQDLRPPDSHSMGSSTLFHTFTSLFIILRKWQISPFLSTVDLQLQRKKKKGGGGGGEAVKTSPFASLQGGSVHIF